ncbi:transcription factor bHLH122-like [Punica granatum]|uniref:Uncharacterized protein n=2 Tax=Punica granatum TaxID=22663 RepID=A0A2I0HSQ3_PUNGR|nr:transcription factor bHLH122-like [Punica granatum]PKI34749.1 hypothetical protein CRG98_044855 [Punica granatum]
MESDPFQNFQSQAQNQQQTNPGLTRYRSAPSSYFTNLLEREFYDEFLNRPTSPETERILSGLMSGDFRPRDEAGSQQPEVPGPGKSKAEIFPRQPKLEQEPQQGSYSASASSSQNYYQSSSHHRALPNQSSSHHRALPNQSLDYRAVGSIGSGSNSSGLLRQSSSPAGLFLNNSNSIEGYGTMRGMGSFGTSSRETSYSPAPRFSDAVNYLSAGQPLSSGKMSPIAEMESKGLGKSTNSPEGGGFDEGDGTNYDASFPLGSWDDSCLNASEAEEGQGRRDPPTLLAHHSSLPKSSLEIERLLQFQDSVPCKIRAKRGCATHPRSIAERVRRTKISERIRKLQDLVPNMDKQTNTAEMLDLAVDYIKELQEQVEALLDSKLKCVCSNRQM